MRGLKRMNKIYVKQLLLPEKKMRIFLKDQKFRPANTLGNFLNLGHADYRC